jgi:hypothetical protein
MDCVGASSIAFLLCALAYVELMDGPFLCENAMRA